MARFRAYVWDPILLISQIVSLQCLFYLSYLLLLHALFHLGVGVPVILDWVFSPKSVGSDGLSWLGTGVYLLESVLSAVWILLVVSRAKLCLDFSVTLYCYHLLFCTLYWGWMSGWWWFCTIVCCAITTTLSEALCIRQELKEIPVAGMGNKNDV
ncbi:hypothetical protein SARC_08573 [Sphaeroforma arctica JP610]|uniref:Protein SYS1 homolog n=1 Tax=Sphaeroforma arctica JP610 TaxID=667725 RepID=A0A0L0FSS2_9EUKA|nr:hypothetical protein SARC_08573 [Sphaeroforma arctica JP610]KNC79013.1 hypothetical protein SARC_08573 [Sphaeroforma arctica JP610]|eukprot:XP_014152915.1 hypothetical protein SARC_08573 [Sphaeroforma arctica JP610]